MADPLWRSLKMPCHLSSPHRGITLAVVLGIVAYMIAVAFRSESANHSENVSCRKGAFIRGQKNRPRKKTNSWERRFPGTFRTNVPLILPIFSVFSVGGGPKVPRNFVPGNFFFLF